MNEEFGLRISAAAVTAWWTVLIAAGFVTVQWVAYMVVMSSKPGWVQAMWGPEMGWGAIQGVWISVIVSVKVAVWLMALGAVWLTLWSRRMRRT